MIAKVLVALFLAAALMDQSSAGVPPPVFDDFEFLGDGDDVWREKAREIVKQMKLYNVAQSSAGVTPQAFIGLEGLGYRDYMMREEAGEIVKQMKNNLYRVFNKKGEFVVTSAENLLKTLSLDEALYNAMLAAFKKCAGEVAGKKGSQKRKGFYQCLTVEKVGASIPL